MIVGHKASEHITCIDTLRYIKELLQEDYWQLLDKRKTKGTEWVFVNETIPNSGGTVLIPIPKDRVVNSELIAIKKLIFKTTRDGNDLSDMWK